MRVEMVETCALRDLRAFFTQELTGTNTISGIRTKTEALWCESVYLCKANTLHAPPATGSCDVSCAFVCTWTPGLVSVVQRADHFRRPVQEFHRIPRRFGQCMQSGQRGEIKQGGEPETKHGCVQNLRSSSRAHLI